jgi:hypothetical protein
LADDGSGIGAALTVAAEAFTKQESKKSSSTGKKQGI